MIKALTTTRITSRLVWDCTCTQNEQGEHSKVILALVPRHKGIKGKEKVDALAAERASKPFIEHIPLCGTTKIKVAKTIAKWLRDKT